MEVGVVLAGDPTIGEGKEKSSFGQFRHSASSISILMSVLLPASMATIS